MGRVLSQDLRDRVVAAVAGGMSCRQAAVWLDGEPLTAEYATEALAQNRVADESDDRRLREVAEPRLYATDHASPQPFLPELAAVEWRPVQRLAPYRPWRQRRVVAAKRGSRCPSPTRRPDDHASPRLP